jgi:hypothetical protein
MPITSGTTKIMAGIAFPSSRNTNSQATPRPIEPHPTPSWQHSCLEDRPAICRNRDNSHGHIKALHPHAHPQAKWLEELREIWAVVHWNEPPQYLTAEEQERLVRFKTGKVDSTE